MQDDGTELLIKWYAWIMQDMRESNNVDTFYEYINLLDWMQVNVWYESLKPDTLKTFTPSESLAFWFEFDRSFDKQSLLDMKPDKEYEIKMYRKKYIMAEICN